MRRWRPLAALLLLAGCAAPVPADDRFGPPEVDGPALSLAVGSRPAVALLLQQNGESRLWRTRDGVVVATDGARVVATAGLAVWVAATRFDGPDPLDEPLALVGRLASSRRLVDLMTPDRDPASMRFGVSLECTLRGRIDGDVLLVEEGCNGSGFNFTNRFWGDPQTGGIYRSEQWVGREAGLLGITVLRPPPA
ncbi:YjbF family lipoprotein [Humitalea sp. 24SJ18S-53]|uniref:YjbF family lipoprotein n=1 Tax=Humitalea sp. 24SJ18S-53 TaxID=3422307 RepID=UPI003D66D303